jgi:peptidoglycan/xylan/chitin deacetylase (PgdA/CDA1 family)
VRRGITIVFALTLGWAVLAGTSTASANTYVSLTFDDGNADQMPAAQMLADHGMSGTFYIITGRVGDTGQGFMTWSQVQSVYDDGNEIGGHTVTHPDLPTLPEDEQRSEICGGRDALLAKGFPQVSFAYPHGDHDATSEALVQECGYLSGRRVGGLDDPQEPKADTIPPQNQWLVRSRRSIDVSDTLTDIESWITDAEAVDAGNGGADAWITLIMHHLCDPAVTDCSDPHSVNNAYITPSNFDSLLDWLEAREPTTRVETMARVMDPNPPSSEIGCNGSTCQSSYAEPVSVTLSATDTGRTTGASGVQNIRYTTDGSTPDRTTPTYSDPIPVISTTTIRWRAEDNAGNVEAVRSRTIEIASTPPDGGGDGDGGSAGDRCTAGPCLLSAPASMRSLPNGIVRLVFSVGGPGTLDAADASAAGTAAVAAKKRSARIRPTSKFASQAGDVTLVIRASKAGKRILRRKGKLTVPVRVTFTPTIGSPAAEMVKARLKLGNNLKR